MNNQEKRTPPEGQQATVPGAQAVSSSSASANDSTTANRTKGLRNNSGASTVATVSSGANVTNSGQGTASAKSRGLARNKRDWEAKLQEARPGRTQREEALREKTPVEGEVRAENASLVGEIATTTTTEGVDNPDEGESARLDTPPVPEMQEEEGPKEEDTENAGTHLVEAVLVSQPSTRMHDDSLIVSAEPVPSSSRSSCIPKSIGARWLCFGAIVVAGGVLVTGIVCGNGACTADTTDPATNAPEAATTAPPTDITISTEGGILESVPLDESSPNTPNQSIPEGGILQSLALYGDLRSRAPENFTRAKGGANLDLYDFSGELEEGGQVAFCHLSSLLPFTQGDNAPWQLGFEDAVAIALAAHHLNVGDGSLVPQVDGLAERCKVRFTTEFLDTAFGADMNATEKALVEQTDRPPSTTDPMPCAFLGALRSVVTSELAAITSRLGYPQVSAGSTSKILDYNFQYSLFARTLTTATGDMTFLVKYLTLILQGQSLAVIYINDEYGESILEAIRVAAETYASGLPIHPIPFDDYYDADVDDSVVTSITNLKDSGHRLVFAAVFTTEIHDALMAEAYRQGVVGNGEYTWLFGDSFLGVLDGRTFEKDGTLHLAYQDVQMFQLSSGVPGIKQYDEFISKMSELHNPADLNLLGSLFPENDDPFYTLEGTPPFVNNNDFLKPVASFFAPFWYDAAIALGLAACDASKENLEFTGRDHYYHLRTNSFSGISGNVSFDQDTATRDPIGAMYGVIKNEVVEEVDPETGLAVVRFEPAIEVYRFRVE